MRWRGWLVEVVLLALFAVLTLVLALGGLLDLDLAVRDWSDAHRPTPLYLAARVLNYFGQGGILLGLSVLAAVWAARRAHTVRPFLPVITAYVGLFLVVGSLKVLTDRAAPHRLGVPHAEELFSGGLSYPSGHVANTIVWYGVLALLLEPVLPGWAARALRIAPPIIVFFITTYLGFHWITDSVAGLFLGLLLGRVFDRVDWDAVPLERLPGGRRLAARGWTGRIRSEALLLYHR
jgi:membrane-associated phospholipid phosphatase